MARRLGLIGVGRVSLVSLERGLGFTLIRIRLELGALGRVRLVRLEGLGRPLIRIQLGLRLGRIHLVHLERGLGLPLRLVARGSCGSCGSCNDCLTVVDKTAAALVGVASASCKAQMEKASAAVKTYLGQHRMRASAIAMVQDLLLQLQYVWCVGFSRNVANSATALNSARGKKIIVSEKATGTHTYTNTYTFPKERRARTHTQCSQVLFACTHTHFFVR